MASRLKTIGLRISSIVALVLLWWAASAAIRDPQILPDPWAIAATIVKDLHTPGPEGESPFFDIGITLARIFVTFSASMIAGTGIGLAMGLNRQCERSLLALIPLMLTMPTILMVFLAIMWFGFSEVGGLVAVMAVVTPYVAVNMFEGTKAMDKSLAEMGVTFKATPSLLLRKVYLPQLMPYIFAALRYGFGQTWKIVALAETFGLKYGIGYMFFFWFEQFDIKQTLAWIMMFVVLMLVLEHGVFARLESRAFAWRNSSLARA
ncbi:MAG TPA: ABC transporter permease subunit [Rhizobiaceae bacterium]|nr:ABC transporter permease subunit [Rhizobiaceae bacterium]